MNELPLATIHSNYLVFAFDAQLGSIPPSPDHVNTPPNFTGPTTLRRPATCAPCADPADVSCEFLRITDDSPVLK